MEAAGYNQYNEVRILLDGGTATVDDRDKVMCVLCMCL